MQIPDGFQFDSTTGLYYREEHSINTDTQQRTVTWFNPNDGSFQQVVYPLSDTQIPLAQGAPQAGDVTPQKKKNGCVIAIIVFLLLSFIAVITGLVLAFGFGFWALDELSDVEGVDSISSIQEQTVAPRPSEEELQNIHIMVDAENETYANEVIFENLSLQESYPTNIPDAEEGGIMYRWDLALDEYTISLQYTYDGRNNDVSPEEMKALLFLNNGSSDDLIEELNFEVLDDKVVFYDVAFLATDGFTLSGVSSYSMRIQSGKYEVAGTPPMNMRISNTSDSESAQTPAAPALGTYIYELEGPGLFAVLNFDTPQPGLVMMDLDFGGSTYTVEAEYTVQDNTVEIMLDGGLAAIGWDGHSQFALDENGLTLISDGHLGVLEPGETLIPQGGSDTTQSGTSSAFTQGTSTFMCMDSDLPEEYRPFIQFHSDGTFYMFINMGEGVYDSSGTYAVNEETGRITLTFLEINSSDPGPNHSIADIDIIDENTLYFITDGFGLMGYGEDDGIFTRTTE